MVRRPSNIYLSLDDIADDWSREIQPPRSKNELVTELGKAWWRGEFLATKGPTRFRMLQILYNSLSAEEVFWVQGEVGPRMVWRQPPVSAAALFAPVLPVPSGSIASWTDHDCLAAYEMISQGGCREFTRSLYLISGGVSFSEPDFTQWIEKFGHTRPEFWAKSRDNDTFDILAASDAASSNSKPSIGARKRGPIPKVLLRVKGAMRTDIESGKFSIEKLMSLTEESLRAEYAASRDTIRRARGEIQSEFVGD